MRKTKFTTLAGIFGWLLTFLATLLFIYVAARVAKRPSSPTMAELIWFVISVLFEGVGLMLLIIWLEII
ncbi:MAG: hypothetical protein GWO20_17745 [Candidatus Korarchaeota archaeon]|nr:hypothetical protein [Candidatus Korarchaeota archaeon]NIU83824.1 hypothetical protein [Candidatus Thorarchaeota archaeon]NIW15238.1 hypothetical protein [Candidatus Thorarchaeota archaeon]NIW53215.1 hypothetical protein [Candidatus Korarchaeota archaeon]